MIINLKNRSNFSSKFLGPISRVSDLAIITIDDSEISSLNKTADNNTILYAKYTGITADEHNKHSLNVPDMRKLIKALDCIESENVNLIINQNNIEYKSTTNKFKFHLLENGIIVPPNININKIESFTYDVEFKLPVTQFNNLLKSSTFITSSDKIYIYTEDSNVLGELTDKSRHNIDSFTTIIADKYQGEDICKPIPFSFELFRIVSTLKARELDIKLNTSKGILSIDIEDGDNKLKYITTSMVC